MPCETTHVRKARPICSRAPRPCVWRNGLGRSSTARAPAPLAPRPSEPGPSSPAARAALRALAAAPPACRKNSRLSEVRTRLSCSGARARRCAARARGARRAPHRQTESAACGRGHPLAARCARRSDPRACAACLLTRFLAPTAMASNGHLQSLGEDVVVSVPAGLSVTDGATLSWKARWTLCASRGAGRGHSATRRAAQRQRARSAPFRAPCPSLRARAAPSEGAAPQPLRVEPSAPRRTTGAQPTRVRDRAPRAPRVYPTAPAPPGSAARLTTRAPRREPPGSHRHRRRRQEGAAGRRFRPD